MNRDGEGGLCSNFRATLAFQQIKVRRWANADEGAEEEGQQVVASKLTAGQGAKQRGKAHCSGSRLRTRLFGQSEVDSERAEAAVFSGHCEEQCLLASR